MSLINLLPELLIKRGEFTVELYKEINLHLTFVRRKLSKLFNVEGSFKLWNNAAAVLNKMMSINDVMLKRLC